MPPFEFVEVSPKTKTSSFTTPSEIFNVLIRGSLIDVLVGLCNEDITA